VLTTTDVGFIEMRIAKVAGFGPPLLRLALTAAPMVIRRDG